jgi:hypothetical protein
VFPTLSGKEAQGLQSGEAGIQKDSEKGGHGFQSSFQEEHLSRTEVISTDLGGRKRQALF